MHADLVPVLVKPAMPTMATAARMPTTTMAISNSIRVNPCSLRSCINLFMTPVFPPASAPPTGASSVPPRFPGRSDCSDLFSLDLDLVIDAVHRRDLRDRDERDRRTDD